MGLWVAYKSRGITKGVTIRDALGNTITPTASDEVRIIIGYEGRLGVSNANAKLVLSSAANSDDGSSITKGAENTVLLKPEDLAFDAGVYDLLVELYDGTEEEWKNVDRQVFVLIDT